METSHSASELLEILQHLGTTHVLGIPDNGSAAFFDRVQAHPDVALVTVTREGEAFAIASGLWIGGASPVVAIQNTGFLESGDALRGTALRMGVPLLCLVGYRGHAKMVRAGIDPFQRPDSIDTLRRPDVDSAALYTEPTMDAWGVPHSILEPGREGEMVTAAWNRARSEERPVALLLTHPTR